MERIYFRIMKKLYPILKFLENIHLKQVSKENLFSRYYEIENKLEIGDVILTKSDLHATNLLNFGFWKHAIIYIGKESNIPYVVEATSEGVVKKTLVQTLSSKDRNLVLRPSEILIEDESQKMRYLNFVIDQIGKPYDYNFDSFSKSNNESFYCSELVYAGIIFGNPFAKFDLRNYFGIITVTPMDLYNMSNVEKFIKILEANN